MKVLIVGSTGFVGKNFVQYLDEKSIPFCTLNRKASAVSDSFTWDNLDEIPFKEITDVFFLTGKAHDLKNVSCEQVYYDVNVGLVEKFIKFAEKHSFKGRFIYVSSVKAIADTVLDVLDENTQPNPQTPYGKSKLAAEKLIASSYINTSSFILRPCMIHGPNNKGNLNQLYSLVKKGVPNILCSFRNERSLLSVDNLLFVFHRIIEGKLQSGVYQVSDEGYLSINEMFQIIARTIGISYRRLQLPKLVVKIMAFFGDYLPIPINSERLQKMTENYKVSNGRLTSCLGQSLPVSIKDGLVKTIESFK